MTRMVGRGGTSRGGGPKGKAPPRDVEDFIATLYGMPVFVRDPDATDRRAVPSLAALVPCRRSIYSVVRCRDTASGLDRSTGGRQSDEYCFQGGAFAVAHVKNK